VPRKEARRRLFVRQLITIAFMSPLGVGLSSCASTYVCRDKQCQARKDFESLAAMCLKLVEHSGPVTTVVVPTDFDSRAQRAFSELRPVVAPERVTPSKEYAVPSGYFELQALHIDDAEAVCSGILGPALRPTMPDTRTTAVQRSPFHSLSKTALGRTTPMRSQRAHRATTSFLRTEHRPSA
jgi:hypothetical protein